MSIWPANTEKVITIIASSTANILIFFKEKDSAIAFQELTNPMIYKEGGIWEMKVSFNPGEYIIKTLVTDNGITVPVINNLIVKDIEEIDVIGAIDDLNNKLTTVSSWNATS